MSHPLSKYFVYLFKIYLVYTDTSFGKTGKDNIVALAFEQDCEILTVACITFRIFFSIERPSFDQLLLIIEKLYILTCFDQFDHDKIKVISARSQFSTQPCLNIKISINIFPAFYIHSMVIPIFYTKAEHAIIYQHSHQIIGSLLF